MKKKIFTLLTLGLMLSFVCVNVNAQLYIDGDISINTTVYSGPSYWPAATDATDAASNDLNGADYLYAGCEYILSIELEGNPLGGGAPGSYANHNGWIYISYPTDIKTTLPDSIPLESGVTSYSIPFTITETGVSRTPNFFQITYPQYETSYVWLLKDDVTNALYGFANVPYGFGNDPAGVAWLSHLTPAVYSFSHQVTFPDINWIKATLVDGDGGNTLFSLDGGVTWNDLTLVSGVHNFSATEIAKMTNYMLLKEPNSCYWTEVYIFGEDYPYPDPITRAVVIPTVPNVTTYPLAGVHYPPSQRDFNFYVTLTGPNVGQPFTVTTDPAEYSDGQPVPIVYTYQGGNTWLITIKRVRAALNIDIAIGVGNEAIAGSSVWAEGGQVFINSVAAGSANVYSATGALVKTVTFTSGETVAASLPAGFYVAVINGKAFKFIIK